jgi:dCMP deaminase
VTSFNRINFDSYCLEIAELVAKRTTCSRRAVGCVLVDSHNHIVATGYNGVPTGFIHCIDEPCEGVNYPSGEGLDACRAVHAELNALLQLRSDDDLTCYLTTTPCVQCAKVICNSKITRIVAREWYVHPQAEWFLNNANITVDII